MSGGDREPARRQRGCGLRPWFDECLAGQELFAVHFAVWASFLRLVTNHRIFEVPTPLIDAFAFIDATCTQPHHVLFTPGSRHLALLRRCCEEADAVGDLVPHAVLVALAVEHGCKIVTLDRDFARFESIRHKRPELAGGS